MGNGFSLEETSRKYGKWLIVLIAIFIFRVGSQLLQLFSPAIFLPAFEDWHSGALPYSFLFIFQVIIISFCLKVIFKFRKSQVHPNKRIGKICLILGLMYFSVMLFRLVVGLTIASEDSWFSARIPIFFHLILASFLVIVGQFHFKYGVILEKTK